jgi:endonuclease G
MKKLHTYILSMLTLVTVLVANPIDDKASQFVINGAPISKIEKGDQYLIKKNYAIHYRFDTKTAEYVVEHPTLEKVNGKSKRKDDFRPDPELPKQHQSQLADYAGEAYDRGHLVPAGDCTQDDEVMSESFFLSNMVPQVPNHNRGIWKQLETAVRNWVIEGKDIYVISGTFYNKEHKEIGQHVGVPDNLWKVIVDAKSKKAIAFWFPNAPLPVEDLPKYIVSISEIEAKTGLDFNPKLPAKQQKELESTKADQKDWSSLNKK